MSLRRDASLLTVTLIFLFPPILLRPSSSTSTGQQQRSTTERLPISRQGMVSGTGDPAACGSTVHYYWGVPFCPRGLDPDSYTQVCLNKWIITISLLYICWLCYNYSHQLCHFAWDSVALLLQVEHYLSVPYEYSYSLYFFLETDFSPLRFNKELS